MMSCHALLRVCTLFLLLLSFFCDCSWGSPLSLEDYRSSIQEGLSRVESEKGALKSEETAFLEEHFPPHVDVSTKSGEAVPVDNGSLLRLVKEGQETDQGREALLAHLKALHNQISFVDKPIPLSEDRWPESRASLEKVFSAREFQGLEEAKDPAWMVFLMEVLRKVLGWLDSHFEGVDISGRWMQYVFYGVILGGVFLLVLWILRTLGPLGWRFRDLKIKSDPDRKAAGMDWQALREESRHKGERGAYREAIRLFFISVLMQGHERGWWVYRREATNREHLSNVEGSSERREALGKMIQVYENAWYGHESPGREALLQCAEWLRLIEAG
jgi:Domain of unknown function (DUF4129)